jgi:signal transduction histidine kinase
MPIVHLIASLVNAAFAGYLLVRAPKSPVRTAAACVIVALSMWQLGEFGVRIAADPATATLWIKFTYAALTLLPLLFFFFTMSFPLRREGFWNVPLFQLLPVIPAALLLALLYGPLLIADATRVEWGFTRIEGPAFTLFKIYLPSALLLSLGNLLLGLRSADSHTQRMQCWYIIAGAICPVILGIIDLNIFQTRGIKAFHYLVMPLTGVAPTIAFVYALLRYRLFDVPAALRSGLIYSALVSLLLLPCVGIYVITENLPVGQGERGLLVAALLLLAGFVFPRIRVAAHETLEHVLFGSHHHYRRILTNAISEVTTILEMQPLGVTLRTRLAEALDIEHVGLWIRNGENLEYVLGADHDDRYKLSNRDAARINEWLVAARTPWEADDGTNRDDGLASTFKGLGFAMCFPLSSKGHPLGMLALGPRTGGRAYLDDELELLRALANQVAVAAENARLYEALKESKQMLQRASRLSAVGTLAAGLAHEIRNPLVAVQTFLQILPERLGDPEVTGELRDVALAEMQRVCRLINDLLGMARSPVATFESADLGDVVAQVVRLLAVSAEKKGVVLKRAGSALPASYIDPARLKQAVLNLVMNAIQASPAGGEITIATASGIDPAGRAFVELAVRDGGPGIPAAHLEAIFHPFFTTKDSGTGLGLAVTQQIIADHGGAIHVESEEGQGATFVVRLPVEEQPPAALRQMPPIYGLGRGRVVDEVAPPVTPADAPSVPMHTAA